MQKRLIAVLCNCTTSFHYGSSPILQTATMWSCDYTTSNKPHCEKGVFSLHQKCQYVRLRCCNSNHRWRTLVGLASFVEPANMNFEQWCLVIYCSLQFRVSARSEYLYLECVIFFFLLRTAIISQVNQHCVTSPPIINGRLGALKLVATWLFAHAYTVYHTSDLITVKIWYPSRWKGVLACLFSTVFCMIITIIIITSPV